MLPRETEIQASLEAIERDENVRILFACESGSRAWGFASTDSDFDVRFIYVRRVDAYLTVDSKRYRDVIELPISDELDVNGWDLQKALGLLRKSNPPLLEWLGSPIIYREMGPMAEGMRSLAVEFHSAANGAYHYVHMARGNYREYLRGETVRLKKYFYVLRPLLGVLWIEAGLGIVPTEFHRLLEKTVDDPAVWGAIDRLLALKMAGEELDEGPRVEEINGFIEFHLNRLETSKFARNPGLPPVELFDQLFLRTLSETWTLELV